MFNLWKAVSEPVQIKIVTPEEVIEMVRTGGENLETILEAKLLKTSQSKEEYRAVKTKKLPCITTNFLFDKVRRDINVIESTGFLYFDWDLATHEEAQAKKEELKLNDSVFACWFSLSGTGVSVLVKTLGVTKENFKNSIENVIGLAGFTGIDTNAKTINRTLVLAYDPEVYFNPNSDEIDCLDIPDEDLVISSIGLIQNLTGVIRLNQTLSSYSEECHYIPEGKTWFGCHLKFRGRGIVALINDGERNKILSTFTNNMVILNPNVPTERMLTLLDTINRKWCRTPMKKQELRSLLDYKIKNRNTLTPMGTKMKYYWIDPTVTNKVAAFHQKVKSVKHEINTGLISDWLSENLTGYSTKITMDVIASGIGMSLTTLRKYWQTEHQAMLDNLNSSAKPKQENNIDHWITNVMAGKTSKLTRETIATDLGISLSTIKVNITKEQIAKIKEFNQTLKKRG
jgi:hypothetical protein